MTESERASFRLAGTEAALVERLVRQDRLAVAASIGAVVALCAAYLVYGPSMPATDGMPDMAMPMGFDRASFLWLAPMWVVMMIGMMLPSAAPLLLLFARLQRVSYPTKNPADAILLFAAGYVVVWAGFSLAAAFMQAFLSGQDWLNADMRLQSRGAQAALLIVAALFEMSPLKATCLNGCRSPAQFLADHRHPHRVGTLRTGAEHGLFCLGCCAALMALLFVGGVMNPLMIGGLAVVVLAQKIAPASWRLDWVVAIGLAAMGGYLFLALTFGATGRN